MTIDRTHDEIQTVLHTAIHDESPFAAGILHFYEWSTGFRDDPPFELANESIAGILPESLEEPMPPYIVTHMYEPIEEGTR
jgi:hypothetical protein